MTRSTRAPAKQRETNTGHRSSWSAPRAKRNFAKVDVANLSDEDDNENPDWLIGAY